MWECPHDVSNLVPTSARVLEHLPSPYFTLSDFHMAPARIDCCTNMIDRVTGILLR